MADGNTDEVNRLKAIENLLKNTSSNDIVEILGKLLTSKSESNVMETRPKTPVQSDNNLDLNEISLKQNVPSPEHPMDLSRRKVHFILLISLIVP